MGGHNPNRGHRPAPAEIKAWARRRPKSTQKRGNDRTQRCYQESRLVGSESTVAPLKHVVNIYGASSHHVRRERTGTGGCVRNHSSV